MIIKPYNENELLKKYEKLLKFFEFFKIILYFINNKFNKNIY